MLRLLHSITKEQETPLLESSCYGKCGRKVKRKPNPTINHALAITLHLLLCSTCYTALQICKKLLCSESILLQKSQWYISHFCAIENWHLALSAKKNCEQSRTKVAPWCLLCGYCGWWKGTSQDKASDVEQWRNQTCSPSIVEVCLAKGIS